MSKQRVFIVHGWGDQPGDHWIPWLTGQLEQAGIPVAAPAMPNTAEPEIGAWVGRLKLEVGVGDAETFYVGHSIGCQTILRHLEQTPPGTRARGAVFVAPWFDLVGVSAEEMVIARPWIETPIDFAQVRARLPELVAFFSPDDPFVSLDNQALFEERLGARTQVLDGRQHFGVESGMTSFPELLATVQAALK